MYKIIKNQNDFFVTRKTIVARSFYLRLRGLMFRKTLSEFDSMLISPCNSIHTFFMFFSLDVLFLNSKNEVIKIIRDLKPWRMTWIYFKSHSVLELPAGKLDVNIQEGDILSYV